MNALLTSIIALTLTVGISAPRAFAEAPIPTTGAPTAETDGLVEVVLTVIHAKKTEGGVSTELEGLGKSLTKAFPNYKSFKRLSGKSDKLDLRGDARVTLPNQTTLVYRNLGWKDGFATLELEVGGMKSTVNVKDGGLFFQAGRAFDGGMIVLAFKVSRGH